MVAPIPSAMTESTPLGYTPERSQLDDESFAYLQRKWQTDPQDAALPQSNVPDFTASRSFMPVKVWVFPAIGTIDIYANAYLET